MSPRVSVLFFLPLLAASLFAETPASAPASRPATGGDAATTQVTAGRIGKMELYYAKTYSEPLRSKDRLPKLIAVVSLSRIDAGPTTIALLEAMKTDDVVVGTVAWEALHARASGLSSEQRRMWTQRGFHIALNGGFPGPMIGPLLRAMAEHHPTKIELPLDRLLVRILKENSLNEKAGRAALEALRDLNAAWRTPSTVRLLINQLQNRELAARADFVLRGLPKPPEDATLVAWNAYLRTSPLAPFKEEDLQKYTGKSSFFPAAEKITDPNDKRWRAELEIGKLAVSDFDVAFALDSTGSMNLPNQLVADKIGGVLRLCSLVSNRARVAAVYFRHEVLADLEQRCCKLVKSNPKFYQVRAYPLSEDAHGVARTMLAEDIPAPNAALYGNMHPGSAVHGGLYVAIRDLKWSNDKNARKIIVLVGDALLTKGTEDAAAVLARQAHEKGFQIYAMTKPPATDSWAKVIAAGEGKDFPLQPGAGRLMREQQAGAKGAGGSSIAGTIFEELAIEMIRSSVSKEYRDRVDVLVPRLLDYAKAMELAEAAGREASDADSAKGAQQK